VVPLKTTVAVAQPTGPCIKQCIDNRCDAAWYLCAPTGSCVHAGNSSQDNKTFQNSFRTSNAAPFPQPKSGVLQLHVFLDRTVIELFASDCSCTTRALTSCECRNSSTVAIAVTGIAFPFRASATNAGLYAKCTGTVSGQTSVEAAAHATVYPLRAAPVKCQPPLCMPPPPPPPPPAPAPPPHCPALSGSTPYMSVCKAGEKGQEFVMDAEGVLMSAAAPSLALGTTGDRSLVLTKKSKALRITVASNGNLRFLGGCAQAGTCGSGNYTCIDSKCGTMISCQNIYFRTSLRSHRDET
jgi:hypothetical protein